MEKKFKICIAMAGAVSAGAFTGGVMDYLLETLELWEKEKEKNRKLGTHHPEYDFSLPMHDVEIDVISGSSAGGITGTLAMLNVADEKYEPVNSGNPQGRNNRFFQSWVEMADVPGESTFEKMLKNDDIERKKAPDSLLNSKPIDDIAEKAIAVGQRSSYPGYISDSLDLILTTTNLRGINFKIDFGGNDKSGSGITSHAGFFRYKLANESHKEGIPEGDDLYYVLDLSRQRDVNYLKDATLSTAAFPIGLKSREVAISQKYVERYPKYLFGKRQGIYPLLKENSVYKFNSIDGGLINNEPFAMGLKILREKNAEEVEDGKYAVIMIDPFPNRDSEIEPENPPRDMLSIAKGMFKSLRNQVMFNQDGILEALELENRTKFLVEPVRRTQAGGESVRAKNDLASAPFSGFAGFLDRSFREHDYHLGRLNCQSFLRYYFCVGIEEMPSRLGEVPYGSAFDRFSIREDRENPSSGLLFPIIPDVRLLNASENRSDGKKYGRDAELAYPEYPSIPAKAFEKKYGALMKRRIEAVANGILDNFWFSLLNRILLRKKIYGAVQGFIMDELRNAGLLKDR